MEKNGCDIVFIFILSGVLLYLIGIGFSKIFLKTAYIKTGLFAGNNYNHIVKYDGRGTGTRNLVDIKVLRLEEVYLNKAEAEYRLNGSGLATLDALRSKRYSSFVSAAETGTALLASILKERRLELAFEMDRFYTLKRLGLPVVRSATNGHFADGTGTPAEALSLPAGDFRWQFPITLEEINNHKLLTSSDVLILITETDGKRGDGGDDDDDDDDDNDNNNINDN